MRNIKIEYGIKPITSVGNVDKILSNDELFICKSTNLNGLFENLILDIKKFLYIGLNYKQYKFNFIIEENNGLIGTNFYFSPTTNPITNPELYKKFYYKMSYLENQEIKNSHHAFYECSFHDIEFPKLENLQNKSLCGPQKFISHNYISQHMIHVVVLSLKNFGVVFNQIITFVNINPQHLFQVYFSVFHEISVDLVVKTCHDYKNLNIIDNVVFFTETFASSEQLNDNLVNKLRNNKYEYMASIPCEDYLEREYLDPFGFRISDIAGYNFIITKFDPECYYFIVKTTCLLDYFVTTGLSPNKPSMHEYITNVLHVENYVNRLSQEGKKQHLTIYKWYYSEYQILCVDGQYDNYLKNISMEPKKYLRENSICFFAHYDKNGLITQNCVDYLRELEKYIGRIIVMTNVNVEIVKNKTKLEVVSMDNSVAYEGYYDFGKYLYGINNYNIYDYDRVILVNDSVIYQETTLKHVFEWSQNNLDVWGILDCVEPGYHIQSWFLVFQSQKSINLMKFYINLMREKIVSEISKNEFCYYCEVLLSWWLWMHGMKMSSYMTCEYLMINEGMKSFDNPSYQEWNTLLKYIPFMKKLRGEEKSVSNSKNDAFRYRLYSYVRGKKCLEIGGPSIYTFVDVTPIYKYLNHVDNVCFSLDTVWEKQTREYIVNGKRYGNVFDMDATVMTEIMDGQYDVVLSSHSLEHIANPLKAFQEWLRILKDGGYIVLILPKKEDTFDHKRSISSFRTIKNKYDMNVGEDDLSTLGEILKLHDIEKDPGCGDFNKFVQRSLENFNNRCLHHYVYDLELVRSFCDFFDCEMIDHVYIHPMNQYFIIKK